MSDGALAALQQAQAAHDQAAVTNVPGIAGQPWTPELVDKESDGRTANTLGWVGIAAANHHAARSPAAPAWRRQRTANAADDATAAAVLRGLDKLTKIGPDGVQEELGRTAGTTPESSTMRRPPTMISAPNSRKTDRAVTIPIERPL